MSKMVIILCSYLTIYFYCKTSWTNMAQQQQTLFTSWKGVAMLRCPKTHFQILCQAA